MSTNGFSLDDMSIGNVTSIQSAVSARKSDAVFNLKGQYIGSRNAMKTKKVSISSAEEKCSLGKV